MDDGAHWGVVEAADPGGAQTQAGERVGDVVFAAADVDFEGGGELNAAMVGGERRIMHSPRERRSN